MDQRSGLERLARFLPAQFVRRQAAQLVVDQRQQLARCLRVAPLRACKDPGDVCHRRYYIGLAPQ